MGYKALVAVLLISSQAAAAGPMPVPERVKPADIQLEPPLQVIPPGPDKIVPLKLGEPAPFTGQLYNPATAMRWGFWLQQWKVRYKLDIARERNYCSAELTYYGEVLSAEKVRARRVEKDLSKRLLRVEKARAAAEHKLNNPGFFRSPWFHYTMGVVTASAMVGLSIWAVDATR